MVRVENATGITVQHCKLSDAGYSAVWLEGWAQNVTIRSNFISRPGFCGVYANGPLPGETMGGLWTKPDDAHVNKHNVITDNIIHDYGKRVGHGSGVWFYQAGDAKVVHNLVQEGPRDAFGIFGCRFGGGQEPGMNKAYGTTLNFWSMLEVLTTRNIEISFNRVSNCVRDTADAGALEYWGVGANNSAHHNCFR
jgi:hypothetical protein